MGASMTGNDIMNMTVKLSALSTAAPIKADQRARPMRARTVAAGSTERQQSTAENVNLSGVRTAAHTELVPAVTEKGPHPIYGSLPIGRDGFLLERQPIHMLNFWHRKAHDICEAFSAATDQDDDEIDRFEVIHKIEWEIYRAALKIKKNNASEVAILINIMVRRFSTDTRKEELGNFDIDGLASVAKQLEEITAQLTPKKHVGALQRGRKLTRSGLLHRYHAFLIQELETLSWNLYGSREYALRYRPGDDAVNARCNAKSRSYPFFDESKLTTRARSVLKSLKIDTEWNDDVPARKSKGGTTRPTRAA